MLIKDIMMPGESVKRVKLGRSLAEASKIMKQNNISALPVVNNAEVVVGVVSARDIDTKCESEFAASGFDYDPTGWMMLAQSAPTGTDPQSQGGLSGIYGTIGQSSVDGCMTRDVVTVRPDEDVNAAISLMAKNKINHLPVVDDDGRLVGLVARNDIIKGLARQAEIG